MRSIERNLDDEVGVEPDAVDGGEEAVKWPRSEEDQGIGQDEARCDGRDSTESTVLVGHVQRQQRHHSPRYSSSPSNTIIVHSLSFSL